MRQHAFKHQPETTTSWSPSFRTDETPVETANDNKKRAHILEARRKRRNRLSAR